jgi:hypothetical protein
MNEFKGTPGPWLLNPLRNPISPTYYCVYVKPGDHKTVSHIALIDSGGLLQKEEFYSNAKLIEAAPDLLSALQLLTDQVERDCLIGSDPRLLELMNKWKAAKGAITKALGE